jgi:hypothetical protein
LIPGWQLTTLVRFRKTELHRFGYLPAGGGTD